MTEHTKSPPFTPIRLPDGPEFSDPEKWAIEEASRLVSQVLKGRRVKACLFGSRAHAGARPYSDLDIGLDAGGNPVPAELMVALRERLEESCIPYHIDLVDLALVPKARGLALEREGLRWDRLNQRLEDAQKAHQSFSNALATPNPSDLERDGIIQRFEYTFEAVWQAAQAFLDVEEGVIARSPRATLRALGEAGLTTEAETVLSLEMLEDRNRTVHLYIESVAREIFKRLPDYEVLIAALIERMRSRHPAST